jgi:Fe-S cluster biogenesis protein NfuA
MREKIEALLEEIRPSLAMHRGNVELVDIDEEKGIVFVRFLGGCEGCPMSQITLKMGIEAHLCSQIPALTEVRAVN